MLKTLAKRFHPAENVLQFLSIHDRQGLESLQAPETTGLESILNLDVWLQTIHYTWFIPVLRKMRPETANIICSLLPKSEEQKLRGALKLSAKEVSVPQFARPFFLHLLKAQIEDKSILPIEQLPPSEMNAILRLSLKQLLHLIDLLGIYDLAAELRQVVDRALLGRIHAALNQQQLQFLHYATKQPMKYIPPTLGIAGWDGDQKAFNNLLHQRGLIRLARGFIDENQSLRWHLTHKIDQPRAGVLLKLFSSKQESQMTAFFKNQVLHLIKRYSLL